MKKRFTISFLIVAIVFAAAYWAQTRLFAPAVTQNPQRSEDTKMQKSNAAVATLTPVAAVVELEGIVERRVGIQGSWGAVHTSDKLGQQDAIRTGNKGRAVLMVGDAIRVEVAEHSQFTISEITETLSNIRLQGGRISARVAGGGGNVLKVDVEGSQAMAETSSGEFSVLRTEDALVTVATTKGRVKLSARGKSVEVGSGQQSVVVLNEEPTAPVNIPASLFLKINTVLPRRINKKRADIVGETIPGVVVTIRGVRTAADAKGSFRAAVPLQEGQNEIVVSAGDVLGRTEQKVLPNVFVDTKAPNVKSEVTW